MTTRERWGTFSVQDHMFRPRRSAPNPAAFVSDVLLFNRLVIPVPPAGGSDDGFWEKFDLEQQRACLKILKVKTDTEDGLALTIPWDDAKRKRFENRMSHAAAFATQRRSPEQPYYNDPFQMTCQRVSALNCIPCYHIQTRAAVFACLSRAVPRWPLPRPLQARCRSR